MKRLDNDEQYWRVANANSRVQRNPKSNLSGEQPIRQRDVATPPKTPAQLTKTWCGRRLDKDEQYQDWRGATDAAVNSANSTVHHNLKSSIDAEQQVSYHEWAGQEEARFARPPRSTAQRIFREQNSFAAPPLATGAGNFDEADMCQRSNSSPSSSPVNTVIDGQVATGNANSDRTDAAHKPSSEQSETNSVDEEAPQEALNNTNVANIAKHNANGQPRGGIEEAGQQTSTK